MTVVIDVGCAAYEDERSIEPLIDRFQPRAFYGFDPNLNFDLTSIEFKDMKTLHLQGKAAWTHDGTIRFWRSGNRSRLSDFGEEVECFDLAELIRHLPTNDEIILKLDCEGAEIPLLEHLHDHGVDEMLSLCLVEWHCETCGTGGGHTPECENPSVPKVDGLRCPVEEW